MIFIRPSHSILGLIKLYLFLVQHFISFDEVMAKASHGHKRSTSGSHLRVIYIHSSICSALCAWVALAWHEHTGRGIANRERQFFLCYLSSVQKHEARFEYRCFRIDISPKLIHFPLLPTKFLRPFEPTTLQATPPQQNTALLCHSEATWGSSHHPYTQRSSSRAQRLFSITNLQTELLLVKRRFLLSLCSSFLVLYVCAFFSYLRSRLIHNCFPWSRCQWYAQWSRDIAKYLV